MGERDAPDDQPVDRDRDDKALEHERDDLGPPSRLVLVLPRILREMIDEIADRAEPERMFPRRAARGPHKESVAARFHEEPE